MEVSAQIPKSWLSVFNYLPQIEPALNPQLKELIENHPSSCAARVDACYFQMVLQQLVSQTHSEGILWRLGSHLSANSLGSFGTFLINAENMEQFLGDLATYKPLWLISNARLAAQISAGERVVRIDSDQFTKPGGSAKAIMLTMQLLTLCRQLFGPSFDFKSVNIPAGSEPIEPISEGISRAQLTTDHANLVLTIGAQWSQAKAINPNPQLRTLLKKPLDQELAALSHRETLADQVYLYIMKCESPKVKLEQVASHFNVSASTFKRRLKEEDANFKDIAENALTSIALSLLLDSNDKLEYIAAVLGFSDRSSFERAFNRWYGVSPTVFRESDQLIRKQKLNLETELPASVKVCNDILSILAQDDYALTDIASAIESDPVFSARILGLANSAFYSTSKCSSILDAVSRAIGVEEVRNLAVLYSATSTLSKGQIEGFDARRMWFIGMVAMQMGRHLKRSGISTTMPMNDLIQLLQFALLGDLVIARSQNQNVQSWLTLFELPLAERLQREPDFFGTNSFIVSAMLLLKWGLPNALAKALKLLARRALGQESDDATELAYHLLLAADTLYATGQWPTDGKLPGNRLTTPNAVLESFELSQDEIQELLALANSF